MEEKEKLSKAQKAFYLGKSLVEKKDYINFLGSFYKFDGKIWKKLEFDHSEMISVVAEEYIQEFEPTDTKQKKEVLNIISEQTIQIYGDDLKKINSKTIKNEINLKDYILDLDTMEKREYTKEDFAFSKLPFNHKEKGLKCDQWKKFLLSVFEYDEMIEKNQTTKEEDADEFKKIMQFIQEFMGYSLIKRNHLHKFLMMVGDGRNGKGTLMSVWAKIIGKENVSYVDIKGINNENQIMMTKNKMVNFSTDLDNGTQLDTGTIKNATSEEAVSGRMLYNNAQHFFFTAKLVIATNELPYIQNVSEAIKSRLILLPFNRTFHENEKDAFLKEKLDKELEDIFSWAVIGLKRLLERGNFDLPNLCKDSASLYFLESDAVHLWVEEEKMREKGAKCLRKIAFISYQKYCRESGRKALGKTNFFKKIRKLGFTEKINNGCDYFDEMKSIVE